MWQPDYIRLLGVRVDNVDWAGIDEFCHDALQDRKQQQIVTVNGEFILLAQANQKFRDAINTADLVIPDSTNVVWLSHWKGKGLKMRTPGADLTVRLAKIAAEKGESIYFLGGRPGVAKKAAQHLQTLFPSVKIAGTSDAHPNDDYALKSIKQSGADIVLVGYGAPKQELWIVQNKEGSGAKILVGVGGTFDMLAGDLPRAPKFFRALHLEWLWRLILQPSRIKRIWNAVVIFPLVALFSH